MLSHRKHAQIIFDLFKKRRLLSIANYIIDSTNKSDSITQSSDLLNEIENQLFHLNSPNDKRILAQEFVAAFQGGNAFIELVDLVRKKR